MKHRFLDRSYWKLALLHGSARNLDSDFIKKKFFSFIVKMITFIWIIQAEWAEAHSVIPQFIVRK